MKTILLTFVAAAFCLATSVQAGEDAAKSKAGSCSDQAKSACCAKVAKKADTSVKGATLLVRR